MIPVGSIFGSSLINNVNRCISGTPIPRYFLYHIQGSRSGDYFSGLSIVCLRTRRKLPPHIPLSPARRNDFPIRTPEYIFILVFKFNINYHSHTTTQEHINYSSGYQKKNGGDSMPFTGDIIAPEPR